MEAGARAVMLREGKHLQRWRSHGAAEGVAAGLDRQFVVCQSARSGWAIASEGTIPQRGSRRSRRESDAGRSDRSLFFIIGGLHRSVSAVLLILFATMPLRPGVAD